MPEELPTGLDRDHMRAMLEEPFQESEIKQRQGGGNSRFSYVPGELIIRRLNAATDGCWDLRIKAIDERPMGNDTLVMATVALTIPGLGTREHIGVQRVSERGGEDLVKGAITDALKKAATLFGVGLHLYDDDAPAQPTGSPPARPTSARPHDRPQPPSQKPRSQAPFGEYGWTGFWSEARAAGFPDKQAVEARLGRTTDGLSPVELRGLLGLGKSVAPAAEAKPVGALANRKPEPATQAAIDPDEAVLITFRERAEAASGAEWLSMIDEAGADIDRLAALIETAITLPLLDTVVGAAKHAGKYTVRLITAERARRTTLEDRVDRLTR